MNMILETMYFMISYTLIILIFFVGLNFLTKGFIWSFIRVKASKGKKILTMVHSITDIYFVPGLPKDGGFFYKARTGTKKAFPEIPDNAIFPIMSVFGVQLNEKDDLFYTKDLQKIKGASAEVNDKFIERAIVAPKTEDKMKAAIILGITVILITSLVTAFIVYGMSQELVAIKSISGNL